MDCKNKDVCDWIEASKNLLQPDSVVWVDGSKAQYDTLCAQLLEEGVFQRVSDNFSPNSFWATSDPSDVARLEGRTFICSKDDAGPTNNWADPDEMREKLKGILDGAMRGRTMYVIPYLMGPEDSPYSKVGFELSDSPYVVVNMSIMARVGECALRYLDRHSQDSQTEKYVRGIHATCSIDPEHRYIVHFPDTLEVVSVHTNYGGNALQGKKCFALRLASVQARDEGWLAEHMLILAITNPEGEKRYIAAAFPSACGKTNLAMLIPPEAYQQEGWKVETLGDDIAWLRIGPDGRLYAINPENGFFGVTSGTSDATNPSALAAIKKGNCIFTNTAFNPETAEPWWEDLTDEPPKGLLSWKKELWNKEVGERPDHANARFTCPVSQCPSLASEWDAGEGVPLSAIIFGGRRATTFPLVVEAFSWQHGTFLGATMSSQTTAAAIGAVGQVRRDPMAMRPFIGYHAAEYFSHWLEMGSKHKEGLPKIFYVNWFRKNADGAYVWPGFSDNMRVLEWVFARTAGTCEADEGPLGFQPKESDLRLADLNLADSDKKLLFQVSREEWESELELQKEFLDSFGTKLPQSLWDEYNALRKRVVDV